MSELAAAAVPASGNPGAPEPVTAPQCVVTIKGGDLPAERLLEAVKRVLSGPLHDLVVRLELARDHAGGAWLERRLGTDPRVRVAPSRSALEEFPASPFHVALPAGVGLREDVVSRLLAELGTAVIGWSVLPDATRVSIVRAWALHRALRTPQQASDFGDVVAIPPRKLLQSVLAAAGSAEPAPVPAGSPAIGGALQRPRTAWARLRTRLRQVDGPGDGVALARWFAGAILRRVLRLLRRFRAASPRPVFTIPVKALPPPVRGAPASSPRSEYPLGVEIVAWGARSRAVFDASRRVAWTMAGQHVDLVVADTAAEAAGAPVPAVVLADSPPPLSVPALDPRTDNPIGWQRVVGDVVGALGPLDRLRAGCGADRVVGRNDLAALRVIHHLEDVAAFHADAVTRAGELARLAAMGVVVHLADEDEEGRRLAPYLGAELFDLMTHDARELDVNGRESLSVRMRRAALREHSLTSRARQVAERVLSDPPPLPLVSILLATRRPELLDRVLATVRRQTYPRLELVLGLHGKGFGEVASDAAGPSTPVTTLRLEAALRLGSVLNALVDAASGTLLTKMDDDDLYGSDHIWDLVLAHEYSQAPLVGKGAEFVYLAASDRTMRRFSAGGEQFGTTDIAGGALLITRHMLNHIGGWERRQIDQDQALVHEVLRAGARVYRTHPHGFLVVRHGRNHTWTLNDSTFLKVSDVDKAGRHPEWAGIEPGASTT